ncbi:hypothetical protein, partial [Nocardia sp. NPDC051981]|uniref:hypothetical protein n=1 Tax=Nocardia sp. NPDC051981 TaxID=3155417 RepID=UPI00343B5BF0
RHRPLVRSGSSKIRSRRPMRPDDPANALELGNSGCSAPHLVPTTSRSALAGSISAICGFQKRVGRAGSEVTDGFR